MIHQRTPLQGEDQQLLQSDDLRMLLSEDPSSALFFDIETTGLSAGTAFVFLIGCICFENGQWILHQFLIRYVQEEGSLLSSFFSLASRYPVWLHFNGNSFDIPFLKKRTEACSAASAFPQFSSVDLCRRYRPLKKRLGLPRMNQRTLEAFLGWNRTDELESREMIDRYWAYSVSGDQETGQLLLCHNRDDLRGMLRIVRLEAYSTLRAGKIEPDAAAADSENPGFLEIQFHTLLPLPRPLSCCTDIVPKSSRKTASETEPVYCTLSVSHDSGNLQVPIFSGTLRYFFPDYRNYYYLPVEGKAQHKSVASFVEKAYREPAKPENCYAEKTGQFLPEPEELFSPALREQYHSRMFYFEYTQEFCTKKQDLAHYTQVLLKHML